MRGRLVLVLAVVAAGVAIAGEAGVLPPRVGGAPASTSGATRMTVPVVRGLPPMVCPGPETLLAPAGADPVPPGGSVSLRALVAPAGVGDGEQAASLRPLGSGAAGIGAPLAVRGQDGQAGVVQTALDHPGGTLLAVPATPDTPTPEVGAIQSTLATGGDLRGLISTGCTAAASDLWLVGGGSGTGRRGRLLLTNPSATTPVTVDVTVHGPTGVVPAPAGQGVVVPAGGQVALLLDALAPGLPAAVVHVHARSGRVAGILHDSVLRGLVPGGADDVPAATGPATRQVVAGLLIQGGSGSGTLDAATAASSSAASLTPGDSSDAASAAGATAVRVAVPGRDEAIVRVRLMGRTGVVDLGARGVATVPGGGVADIPVTGVPDGVYAALIKSDVPVVAGAIVGRASPGSARAGTALDPIGTAPPSEFGWAAASPPVQGTALAVLPPATRRPAGPAAAAATPGTSSTSSTSGRPSGGNAGGGAVNPGGAPAPEVSGTVTLASIGGGTAVIREISADGTVGPPTTVSVGAGATAAYPVGATAAGVLLTGGPDLYAALVLSTTTGEPMISVLPLAPQAHPSSVTPFAVEEPTLGLRP